MIGRVFMGRYEATRLLGEGGMGRVYLAKQEDLGRQVVVKVMHDHIALDPKFRERFERETKIMAHFQHPYAVTLYDASVNDPQGPCIVMEYIRGITLDVVLENNKGRLGPARVGRLLGQLCEVLQAAHTAGIVHRDLKPANIMVVDADTPYEKIKVMDFGLAKPRDPGSFKKVTDTGAEFAVGTPGYICPEQVRGEEMDHRGDIYSIGVILYEMLTGRLPFAGRSTMDILLAHATESPPAFTDVGAGEHVPAAIEKVVQDCLAKDPNQRPQSTRELAERYEAALAHEDVALEQEAAKPAAPKSSVVLQKHIDPNAIVHELDAWMPSTIAAHKLRGFVQDAGGEVVESAPGVIRVLLGRAGSPYMMKGGPFSWLGIGRKAGMIEMELRLQQSDSERDSMLHITVLMRSINGEPTDAPLWRARCNQIYVDLRAYLMGQTGTTQGG